MAKNLGSVLLGRNKELLSIVSEVDGLDDEYFDCQATWDMAEQYMGENGCDSAEVRINGLDFVEVWR